MLGTRSQLIAVVLVLLACSTAFAQSGPPVEISSPPQISGTARVGQVLNPSPGAWTPPEASATYEWLRCDANGGGCGAITAPGALSAYTVTGADMGHTLRVRLTVSATSGDPPATQSDTADSAPTPMVPSPPVNTAPPSVSGTLREGLPVTASPGTWGGNPAPTLSYQWERCNAAGLGCAQIGNGTSRQYLLTGADVGGTVRVAVTAVNGGGTARTFSAATGVIVGAPLVNREPPSISGDAEVGRSLSASPGRWTPGGNVEFAYRWLRCTAAGSDCAPIAGATASRYEVMLADASSRLGVRVTATRRGIASARDSALTSVVPVPPGAQGFAQGGSAPSAPAGGRGPSLMRPFPRVRIRGFFTARGAVLRLVTITGPRGARVTVSCRGRSCPYRRRVRRSRSRLRLKSLEKPFRAGTRIELRVTRRGVIGKYTRITIRGGRAPARRDRCLRPGRSRPVRCPSG